MKKLPSRDKVNAALNGPAAALKGQEFITLADRPGVRHGRDKELAP